MKRSFAPLFLATCLLNPVALADVREDASAYQYETVDLAGVTNPQADLCVAMAEALFSSAEERSAQYERLMTLPEDQLLANVSAAFEAATSTGKTRIIAAAMAFTEYATLPDLIAPKVGEFAKKKKEIQQVSFVSKDFIVKSAHAYGSAVMVSITGEGDVPESLRGLSEGMVRFAPGSPGKMPAYSLALFGDGKRVETRVFANSSGTTYDAPVGQTILGITVAGVEGPCVCTATPGGPLAAIDVREDPRPLFNAIPVGTVLARMTSEDPDATWSLTITTTSPMTSNLFADGYLRYQRTLKPVDWKGYLALKLLGTLGFMPH